MSDGQREIPRRQPHLAAPPGTVLSKRLEGVDAFFYLADIQLKSGLSAEDWKPLDLSEPVSHVGRPEPAEGPELPYEALTSRRAIKADPEWLAQQEDLDMDTVMEIMQPHLLAYLSDWAGGRKKQRVKTRSGGIIKKGGIIKNMPSHLPGIGPVAVVLRSNPIRMAPAIDAYISIKHPGAQPELEVTIYVLEEQPQTALPAAGETAGETSAPPF